MLYIFQNDIQYIDVLKCGVHSVLTDENKGIYFVAEMDGVIGDAGSSGGYRAFTFDRNTDSKASSEIYTNTYPTSLTVIKVSAACDCMSIEIMNEPRRRTKI